MTELGTNNDAYSVFDFSLPASCVVCLKICFCTCSVIFLEVVILAKLSDILIGNLIHRK